MKRAIILRKRGKGVINVVVNEVIMKIGIFILVFFSVVMLFSKI